MSTGNSRLCVPIHKHRKRKDPIFGKAQRGTKKSSIKKNRDFFGRWTKAGIGFYMLLTNKRPGQVRKVRDKDNNSSLKYVLA